MHTRTHTHAHTHTHTHTRTHTLKRTHMHVHVYTLMCTCTVPPAVSPLPSSAAAVSTQPIKRVQETGRTCHVSKPGLWLTPAWSSQFLSLRIFAVVTCAACAFQGFIQRGAQDTPLEFSKLKFNLLGPQKQPQSI